MGELLTAAAMLDVLRDLHAVFATRMTEDELTRRARAYHDALRGHDANSLRWAANQCIQEDNYFPKPSRLLELVGKYRASQNAKLPPTRDLGRCPSCNSHFAVIERFRVSMRVADTKRGERFPPKVLVTACGNFALLEQFIRELCPSCTLPCEVPHPDYVPAVMPVDQLTGFERQAEREKTDVVVEDVGTGSVA